MSKATKWRPCPVTQADIRAAECGENRNSTYACPADCRFNPFVRANYDQLLEIEQQVDKVVMELFSAEWQTRPWLMSKFKPLVQKQDILGTSALVNTVVFLEKLESGATIAERFIEQGMPGLKNDHRFMFLAKARIEPVLFEFHEVIDDTLIRAANLFRPSEGDFLVADRSLAARMCRFQVGFGWTYSLPHFRRIHGGIFTIGDFAELEPIEVMSAVLNHLGCPPGGEERRRWLIENAPKIEESLTQTTLARNQRMLDLSDAKIKRAHYAIRGPVEAIADELDKQRDITLDDVNDNEIEAGYEEAWTWFETPINEEAEFFESEVVLGKVLFGERGWTLETLQSEKMPELMRRFESVAAGQATFLSEEEIDVTPQVARNLKIELVAPSLVDTARPLSLSTTRSAPLAPGETGDQRAAEAIFTANQQFLDESVPALGNLTPREAATSGEHRKTLIRLMKIRIRDTDQRNLSTGRRDSLDWMVKELGLSEIDFAPPPARSIPPETAAKSLSQEDLPEAPRLPVQPLSDNEIVKRLAKIARTFRSPKEHMDALERAGGTGPLDVDIALGELLDEQELSLAIALITKASFVLVPPGYRFPNIDMDIVFKEVGETIAELDFESDQPGGHVTNAARQPVLVAAMGEMLRQHCANGSIRPESVVAVATFLTAYTNELDRQLRD